MRFDVIEVGLEGLRRVRDAVHEHGDELDQVRRSLPLTQKGDALVTHLGERGVVRGNSFLVRVWLLRRQLLNGIRGGVLELLGLFHDLRRGIPRELAQPIDSLADTVFRVLHIE